MDESFLTFTYRRPYVSVSGVNLPSHGRFGPTLHSQTRMESLNRIEVEKKQKQNK
jgi:hypothetical protein